MSANNRLLQGTGSDSRPSRESESPFLDEELTVDADAGFVQEQPSRTGGLQVGSPFQNAFGQEREHEDWTYLAERELEDKWYAEALARPLLSSQPDRFETEIIGNKDSRIYLRNTILLPFRWICSLQLYTRNPDYPQGDKWLRRGNATGVLIGPSCVLTSAHILQVPVGGKQRSVERMVITPGKNGHDAPFGRTEAKSGDWRTPKAWDSSKEPRMWDFAVIRLNEAFGAKTFKGEKFGWWGSAEHGRGTSMKPIAADWLKNRLVRSAGYPGNRCGKRVLRSTRQISQCANRWPELWASTQWYARGRVRKVNAEYSRGLLRHTIDATKGQSGSPIWYYYKGRRWLVGLHVGPGAFLADEHGRMRPAENSAVWIRQEVLDTIKHLEQQLS